MSDPAKPPAKPRARKVVGEVSDDRRRDGVEQPRDGEDHARLPRFQSAEGRVEEQHPSADDGHRPRAEHVVGAIRRVVVPADGAGSGGGEDWSMGS